MAIKPEQVIAPAAIALAALAIAWTFAATTLAHTHPMGLPLDDSYIYLTYAKQIGRGQPFTYFPGGGYSAGSTSVLWPMVLAPFWTLGARGHALVWVAFGMGALLYAAVAIGCHRFARGIGGELAGIAAAVVALAAAPFAWCALSGMEVGFAAALAIATLLLLARAEREGPPTKRLGICLAALSLSRPEMTLVAAAVCLACAVQRRRTPRAAAWWLAPLAAPVVWLAANRVFAGHFFPNTGVAKSHFYLPGFDWTYWFQTVWMLSGRMLRGLFWDGTSPLVVPRIAALLYLAGAVRLVLWARRERRYLACAFAIGAPLALMFGVVASSGLWSFQNYRYIAAALPLLAIPIGIGLAPVFARGWRWITWQACGGVALAAFAYLAVPNLRDNALLFAQGASDSNTQVVAIGHYLHDKLPDARVMFHDAGAIAYYGDGRVYDMLGLVTNHQAEIANNGPGSRFEFLESLPPDQRPTHFAYYPAWMGQNEFYGDVLMHTYLTGGFAKSRLAGEGDMQVIAATWDHAGTGERPVNDHPGWAIVDRVDIADLASERAHHWHGALGRRHFGDPTARWSVVEREVGTQGLIVDGGRTIRGGHERFTVSLDPAKPARVVIRTGGKRAYDPWNETIDHPITMRLLAGDKELGKLTIAAPAGTFSELTFDLPKHAVADGEVELSTDASGPYRVFHWFVLQPEK
jgi:hypothetical protein